jgi:hypothetical protein
MNSQGTTHFTIKAQSNIEPENTALEFVIIKNVYFVNNLNIDHINNLNIYHINNLNIDHINNLNKLG